MTKATQDYGFPEMASIRNGGTEPCLQSRFWQPVSTDGSVYYLNSGLDAAGPLGQ